MAVRSPWIRRAWQLRPVRFALLLIPTFAALWGGVRLAGFSPESVFPLWLLPLGLLCGCAAERFWILKNGREKWAGLIFSFLLLLTQLVGRQFDFPAPGGILTFGEPIRWLYCLLCAAGLSPVIGWPVTLLLQRISRAARLSSPVPMGNGRFFSVCLMVLMLLWLPCHLAYFPGLAEYDSGYQLWQSWNHTYNASNPLIHTFILGFFYLTGEAAGSVSAGLAVLCFLQQLFMAACLSWALTVLRKSGAPRGLLLLFLAFFGLLPVFGMMSISLTKDIPFYCLVLLQLTLIFDLCHRPDALRNIRCWLVLAAVTILACLFRANAMVFMFLIPPLVCLGCRDRAFRRRLFCCLMIGTLLAAGINALMISAVHADSPLLRESLNIPIIQLARVSQYHEDVSRDLTENRSDLVSMPMAYIPYVVDLAKWNWTVDTHNLGDFLALWAKWGAVYPADYMDAALLLSKGYWYLWDRSYAKVYGESYEQHFGAIPSRVSAGIDTIEETCLLPELYEHYEHMYSENHYLDIPGYRLLLCPAFYVWILLFALASAVCQKRMDVRIPVRICCLYLIALLLGPCCILRYALLFLMMTPILIGMLTTQKSSSGITSGGENDPLSIPRKSPGTESGCSSCAPGKCG